ncbi:hypothetical protein EJ04DRAFT_489123 [Polyplosphaeria fusca]|uniref:Uncharacterized protein n=1 Tax=Polyplosphaeria fusca TaxID=682080 RepID=A0A9P4R4T6_9PLEO|nr:hypothetical protein EJ04DRAFT_489123 [Polyplosphaeria fusca]
MQLPKLTPLQSRLLASLVATGTLLFIWISFQPQHFVYAADLPLGAPEENWTPEDSIPHSAVGAHKLELEGDEERLESRVEESNAGYQPDFGLFDRGVIGRAPEDVDQLENNEKKDVQLNPGSTLNFVLASSGRKQRKDEPLELRRRSHNGSGEGDDDDDDELKKRQDNRQVFVSVSTCRQPTPNVSIISSSPGQLTLWLSTSSANQKPGPGATDDATEVPFRGGFANATVSAGSDVYIGVSAPSLTQGWNGSYSFEVAASTDRYYHSYSEESFLFLVDSDSDSALFITRNLSSNNDSAVQQEWLGMEDSPFSLFAYPVNGSWGMGVQGLMNSYCGLQTALNTKINISSTMTNRSGGTLGSFTKSQLHLEGLNASTEYAGILVMNGSMNLNDLLLKENTSSQIQNVPPGGRVFKQFSFTTKADDSCQVIFGLDFCTDIAYAVPSSPEFKTNTTILAALYDNQAREYYENFTKSLAQVACDTTGTAQYSLARTCTDCANDYKTWLCSVLMPRCEDWSATDAWLHPRNINTPFPNGSLPDAENKTLDALRNRFAYNQSRNSIIDETIKPGPYKELLPCDDLCYDIVRSCPAQLQFSCPNEPALSLTYHKRDRGPLPQLQCNFPGAVVELNPARGAAEGLRARLGVVVGVVVMVVWGLGM